MSEEPGIVHRGGANATAAATVCRNAFVRETLRGSQAILVGYSGGADSTALLVAMVEAWRTTSGPRPRILAVHVDHGVRSRSAEDAADCARVAAAVSLPFRCLRADPGQIFRDGHASEGRLRSERYRLFRQAAAETGASAVFLAHHRGDQVETVVLAALRGSGLRGLRGIPRRRTLTPGGLGSHVPDGDGDRPRDGALPAPRVVRPFLDLPREVLLESVLAAGLPYLSDPTNDDRTYLRNHVRHDLLPRLWAASGPGLDDGLIRLARRSRILWRRAERRAERQDLADSDSRHAALQALSDRPLSGRASRLLQEALGGSIPRQVTVHPGLSLEAGAGVLRRTPDPPPPLARPDISISIHEGHAARLTAAIEQLPPDARRRRIEQRGRLYLDADAVRLPICVRHRERGDRIRILGSSDDKRLKTLMIARSVPRTVRDQLVVFCDRDRLLGFEGGPPAAHARQNAATRRTLRIVVRRP